MRIYEIYFSTPSKLFGQDKDMHMYTIKADNPQQAAFLFFYTLGLRRVPFAGACIEEVQALDAKATKKHKEIEL